MMPSPWGSWCNLALRHSLPALVLASLGLPSLAQQTPVALFTTDPNPAEGGAPLLVQFFDQSKGTVTGWNWDFGDGTGSGLQNPVHVYTTEAAFDVTLTVFGPGGASSFTLEHAVDVLPTTNGVVGAPPPLGTMLVPVPDDLAEFVRDPEAAVRLGKALFWDLQLGSDGLTACASCHYHAGVDNRVKNTLHPGADGVFDELNSRRGGGPNYVLNSGDFPFRKFLYPNNGDDLIQDSDDRRGAAGVLGKTFAGTAPGAPADFGDDLDDSTFEVDGVDVLRVTGRDAPSAIGAIFFHRLFWDGRANHFFNGRNIWGNTDPSEPKVLELLPDGSLGETAILLEDAAAASQAIGPPLSDVEMSWLNRSWRDLGRKMVGRRPLASQHVDLTDSVLGDLANPAGPGLRASVAYADLIRAAFHERWWGSTETSEGFTQMEANFSLFFGLAIQSYEATLVPDQTPYDAWAAGDVSALNDSELRGLQFFVGAGSCINCHGTPMFAGALRDEIRTPDAVGEGALERMAMKNALLAGGTTFDLAVDPRSPRVLREPQAAGFYGPDGSLVAWTRLPAGLGCGPAGASLFPLRTTAQVPGGSGFLAELRARTDGSCGLEFDFRFEWNESGLPAGTYELRIGGQRFPLNAAPSQIAVYDNGFYNIGVRTSADDLGVGANGPFGPLSMTRRVQSGEDLGHSPGVLDVPWFERVAVDGAFKTPTLRNVELTGPYMHNGSMASLEQVAEFYARGGDFSEQNARDLDPDIGNIKGMSEQTKADLVAFLKALTDPRVRHERAPFDHPQLVLKEGMIGDHERIRSDATQNGIPVLVSKPATGAGGGAALQAFDERLHASVTIALLEQGPTTARLGFVCDKRPLAPVTVDIKLSRPGGALSSSSVVFTPDNWRVGQEVLLTSPAPDAGSVTVITARAKSLDPEFSGLPVNDLVLDFSSAPVTASDGQGSTAVTLVPGGMGTTVRKP